MHDKNGVEIEPGNMVEFVSVRYGQNEKLKKHEGDNGEVVKTGSGLNEKVLVRFNNSDWSEYWIEPERLEVVRDEMKDPPRGL
jgi:hypothetical protein